MTTEKYVPLLLKTNSSELRTKELVLKKQV